MRVEVYTRAHCSLCGRAEWLVEQALAEVPFELVRIDIDSDPELKARYRYEVPLVHIEGRAVLRHRFTATQLRDALRGRS